MCVSVCLSVSTLLVEPVDKWTQNLVHWLTLDNIWDEFEGQGHRSKVKVARLKNLILKFSGGLTCLSGHMASYDVFGQEYLQEGHNLGGPSMLRCFYFFVI